MSSIVIDSPVGFIEIKGNEEFISSAMFYDKPPVPSADETPQLLFKAAAQFQEYFSGTRKEFDLRIQQTGTDFQQKVWAELCKIPYGETISYLDLAKRLGDVKSIRAAGTANGKNMISIIVPCHRVIGTDGSLTGYAGGLFRKDWLLRHEGGWPNTKQISLFD
ncbi:MAG TPA: methylated-DNA--[protein]-cysteine S-methyltransferase [Bacteroidia bacterium]|nr:methylated-DNA--[protein]-cysteine S-methyltransferase [Bacteroidia bacterium]